jgi:2-succinyl-6-hydroxy-2,4-cyclohexadiene-1-carboxylate synthase
LNALPYTESGRPDARPVLFLHGFMGTARDWAPVCAALSDRYRCLAVDLPGHGGASGIKLPVGAAFDAVTEALTAVLDRVGLDTATLVGYSMGGRLALYAALQAPDRFPRLVLESASPGLEDAAARSRRVAADEARAQELEGGSFANFLTEWYHQPLFASLQAHERLIPYLVETRGQGDPVALATTLRVLGTGRQPSLWDRLPGLTADTLALAGCLDEKYAALARRMAVLAPTLRAEFVPDAGHTIHLEAPEAFIGALTRFLEST